MDHTGNHEDRTQSPDTEKQTEQISNPPFDVEPSSHLIQTTAETPPHAVKQPNGSRSDDVETSEIPKSIAKEAHARKDRGGRHVVRGSVLSRRLLRILEQRGENVRALRRMESGLRAALKPKGPLGQLLFDRFWASYLRLILVAHLEEAGLATQGSVSRISVSVPSLREGAVPILMLPSNDEQFEHDQEETFSSEVFRRLALVSRYDRAAGREMYRTLDRLLMMRDI